MRTGRPKAAIAAVAVACAVSALAAACGGVPSRSAARIVPWIDAPAIIAANASSSTGPNCSAKELSLAAGVQGAFRGQATQGLVLTNTSAFVCLLPSPITVALAGNGRSASVKDSVTNRQVAIGPSQAATVLMGTPGACPGADHARALEYTEASIVVPSGSVGPVSIRLDAQCGDAQIVTVEAPPIVMPSANPSLARLDVGITAATSVARGHDFDYTILLTNNSSTAVSLNPCPTYTESINSGGHVTAVTYELNCAVASSIAPSQTVAFAIKLHIPADQPTGPAKLSWRLTGSVTSAGGATVVTN